MNLSKMAGFNISLSLNESQSSSDKKNNKSLRLVLFIPFRHRGMGRGVRGAAAPPNVGQLRFFGQREKILAKAVIKDVSMFS